jgi:hypothetical protein
VSHVFVFIERAVMRVGHVGDLVVDKRQALMMADIRLAQRDVEGGGGRMKIAFGRIDARILAQAGEAFCELRWQLVGHMAPAER